ITSLRPVIDSGCSKQALFLFCSSLFPLCSPTAPRPVHPCRSLCEQVRKDCFSDPAHSKLWPAYLDCRALPQPEKHELCMQVPSDATGSIKQRAGPSGPTYHLPVATTGGTAGTPSPTTTHDSVESVVKGWSISNLTSLLQQHAAVAAAALEYDRCVPRCGPTIDALYSQRQKELVELWTLVLSAVCFIFTLTSLVSFWAKASKLEYPDRPILFMTLCYNLLGLCYLERTILHSPRRLEAAVELMLLDAPGHHPSAATATHLRSDCTITSQCLAYYILKHYLLLSASTWWLIFGLCWYLSTAKQWSCEALERKSGLFHVLAWVVPFAAPIGALLRGHIQRFELTGFCNARGFTELPVLLLLLLGTALVSCALAALARLRHCWNQRAPHLGRVFGRVLLFAVCYLLPALSATVCMMLERVDHELEPCPAGGEPGDGCVHRVQPHFSLLPTVLRLALTLLGGGSVGVWLWSRQPSDTELGPGGKKGPAQPGCYSAAADLMLLKGGGKPHPSGPLDDCSMLGGGASRRLEHRALGDAGGPTVRREGRYKDADRRRSSSRSLSGAASPYRSRTVDKPKPKAAQKVCYTYRPCAGVLAEHGVGLVRAPGPEPAGPVGASEHGQRSPYAGGTVSNGGYVPVRVHRSLRT
uniref:Frizzled receptor 3 n=1 Tax=Anopheles coluzzii TaxID=1518534 RepID=A0A8W7PD61_ANOCL